MELEFETTYEGYPKELLKPVKTKLDVKRLNTSYGHNYQVASYDDRHHFAYELNFTLRDEKYSVSKTCYSCGSILNSVLNYPECEIDTYQREVGFYSKEKIAPRKRIEFIPFIRRKKECDQYKALAQKEYERLKVLKQCPVCGNELESYDSYDAEKRKEEHIALCEASGDAIIPQDDIIKTIKSDANKLKDYILHLITLEAEIYATTERLSMLYQNQFVANQNVTFARCYPVYNQKCDLKKIEKTIGELNKKLIAYEENKTKIEAAQIVEGFKAYPDEPVAPSAPEFKKPGMFNKKKVLAENEAKERDYQRALDTYEADMIAYREEVENIRKGNEQIRMNAVERVHASIKNVSKKLKKEKDIYRSKTEKIDAMLSNPDDIPYDLAFDAKASIDNEIETAEKLLYDLYKCRNELYSVNIVFKKYRNIVALSTFYEYLMSGRCTALEGADGAYNLYEAEIRADRIIDQISTIVESLEDIKENQYMMYSKMQQINSSLENIDCSTNMMMDSVQKMKENSDTIAENSAITAHNTAVSAFYAKKNAELTDALGYLVALQ